MSAGGFGDQPDQGQFGQGQFGQGQFGQGQFGQGQFGQGQFGQPGWQQPPYGGPGPAFQGRVGQRTNPLAIAALCCAIGQVIAGPFAGITAIVLGAMSLKQIRLSGEAGRGLAITGLVLGIVGTILAVLLVVLALAIWRGASANFSNFNNLGN
jgi:hypothetical protein